MTIQITQLQPPEAASLLTDTSTPTSSDKSFHNYLEEEQKRLLTLFAPLGQFNFNAWFSYPVGFNQAASRTYSAELFGDIELNRYQNNQLQQDQTGLQNDNQTIPVAENMTLQLPKQLVPQNNSQAFLQDLLIQTGWLAPNLEAQPLFLQAQLEGKLLSKLDMQSLIDQILDQVRLVQSKGKVELTIGLKPENMGEIILSLTAKSGMISIQIAAPEESKKTIQDQLAELELALRKAKVNLADISIIDIKEVSQHA